MNWLTQNKKWINAGALAVLSVIYLVYLYFSCRSFDSDMAGMVLEAHDILQGNIMLSDWYLTGILFITTDLLFFVIGVLVFGVSVEAYMLAHALTFFTAVLGGLLLLNCDKHKVGKIGTFAYLAITAFPCFFRLDNSKVHIGLIVWVFAGLYSLVKAHISEDAKVRRNKGIIATFCFTMAAVGDSVSLLMMVAPLGLVAAVNLFRSIVRRQKMKNNDILSVIVAGASLVLSQIIQKLYCLIGGADMNDYIGTRKFIFIDAIWDKLVLFFKGLFYMYDGNFENQEVARLQSVFMAIYIVVALVGLILVISNIVAFVKDKETDFISLVLSIGFALVVVVYLLTGISIDIHTTRYYEFTPYVFSIITIRYFYQKYNQEMNHILTKIIVVGVGLMFIVPKFAGFAGFNYYFDNEAMNLVQVMKDNNLKNGYSAFWDACYLTVYAGNDVTIRQIKACEDDNARPETWFCNMNWYDEYADFVVINEFTEENAIRHFGEPVQIIECGRYKIYKYDRDISQEIKSWWTIEEGNNVLELSKTFFNSNFTQEFGKPYVSQNIPGYIVFGPFRELPAGEYTIKCNFSYVGDMKKGTKLAEFNINSNNGDFDGATFTKDLVAGETSVTLDKLVLEAPCSDFELVVRSPYGYPGIVVESFEIFRE